MLSGTYDYNLVAYPGRAYPDLHPGNLAAMAILRGMQPAPVDACRVLEVGCGDGTHLIPMAYAIPGSEFTGFDLAAQPIVRGRQLISQLGLSNIQLFQANIMEVNRTLGQFDYIIAHGFYTWVPDEARESLMAFCKAHLSPDGIAMISYASLPGAHVRNLLREIMLQVPPAEDGAQFVSNGLELLKVVASLRPQDDPLRALLEQRAEATAKRNPYGVYHDELTRFYKPVSFAAFMSHAQNHGLQYVSECTFPAANDPCFQPQAVSLCRAMANGDPIAEEQLLDTLRMRAYRETLLCHAEVPLEKEIRSDAFDRMLVTTSATASSGEDGARTYSITGTAGMESKHSGTIAMMDLLIQARPKLVPFPELASFMQSRGVDTGGEFTAQILRLAVAKFIDLHAWQPPVQSDLAVRPRASSLCREASTTYDEVVTLSHTALDVRDPVVRRCVQLLDGSRDRTELLVALRQQFPEIPEEVLLTNLEPMLQTFNGAGLFVADDAPLG